MNDPAPSWEKEELRSATRGIPTTWPFHLETSLKPHPALRPHCPDSVQATISVASQLVPSLHPCPLQPSLHPSLTTTLLHLNPLWLPVASWPWPRLILIPLPFYSTIRRDFAVVPCALLLCPCCSLCLQLPPVLNPTSCSGLCSTPPSLRSPPAGLPWVSCAFVISVAQLWSLGAFFKNKFISLVIKNT